jgi:histidinol dehydrogenase
VPAIKLIAADIAGADAVYRMSGAQAIAAFAYGTETVPNVDIVCGPGNIFVTLAKREVFGEVGIDALYGPSETIVIADESANPALCAADLLAQAEHDELATPIMITTSRDIAERTSAEIERQLKLLEREAVARAALDARGGAVVVESVEQAMELGNQFAPEHFCLLVRDAAQWVSKVRNAGGVFAGETSPEVLGDYTAGPSHVMPTLGSARFASPLGVQAFLKATSVVAVDAARLRALGPAAAKIARAEGFTAHARSIEMRLGGE